jgi:hypothetical protein
MASVASSLEYDCSQKGSPFDNYISPELISIASTTHTRQSIGPGVNNGNKERILVPYQIHRSSLPYNFGNSMNVLEQSKAQSVRSLPEALPPAAPDFSAFSFTSIDSGESETTMFMSWPMKENRRPSKILEIDKLGNINESMPQCPPFIEPSTYINPWISQFSIFDSSKETQRRNRSSCSSSRESSFRNSRMLERCTSAHTYSSRQHALTMDEQILLRMVGKRSGSGQSRVGLKAW